MRFLWWVFALMLLAQPKSGAVSGDALLREDLRSLGRVIVEDEEDLWREEERMTLERDEKLFPSVSVVRHPLGEFLTVVVDAASVTFRDVPLQSWFSPYVRDAVERNIVSGYRDIEGVLTGFFGPGNPVTVAELAKMAVRAVRVNEALCPEAVNATARDDWSARFVACAEERGWVLYSDGTIDVRRPASRAEVLVTILQAFGVIPDAAMGDVFADVPASLQFSSFIERAEGDRIVTGYRDAEGELLGIFGPGDPVLRAEIAKIISVSLQKYVTASQFVR